VAGGWAIDLFLDEVTRDHEDVEIGIFRPDQQALRRHFADWGAFKAERPGHWDAWGDEFLELPIHQVLLRPPGTGPPRDPWEPITIERQFFLDDVEDGTWVSRRDTRLRLPVERLSFVSKRGVPAVVPEVQLLYKARHDVEKNEHDFALAAPRLTEEQRTWLRGALELVHPGHQWIDALCRAA
jgi:hypothetical protein